eukprot:1159377-Pelagomonas_calceolata.AAC.8
MQSGCPHTGCHDGQLSKPFLGPVGNSAPCLPRCTRVFKPNSAPPGAVCSLCKIIACGQHADFQVVHNSQHRASPATAAMSRALRGILHYARWPEVQMLTTSPAE